MKNFIKKLYIFLPAVMFTLSCGLSGDMASKIGDYNTDIVVTISSVTSATAVYNNTEYTVTISSSIPDTTIKYTVDGTDPSRTNGTEYNGPFMFDTAGRNEIRSVTYDRNKISSVKSITLTVGDGSVGYPFEIATDVQLNNACDNVNAGSHAASCFRQIADIDLSSYSPWTPVGGAANVFTGTYDGGNFNITNLTINATADRQGLFGQVSGTLTNINIVNAVITAAGYSYVGVLAGYTDSASVENCTVSGTSSIAGDGYVGGLIGSSDNSVISYCTVDVTVTGSDSVGGLIGYNNGSSANITYCNTTGTVNASGSNTGGFVGNNDNNAYISYSYSLATVNASSANYVGGFAGRNGTGATIYTGCYAIGDVFGAGYTGGFVGCIETGTVGANNYSTGNVTGTSTGVGGFCGVSNSDITDCYAKGNVNITGSSSANSAGGFIGVVDSCNINTCFARGNVDNSNTSYTAVGGFAGTCTGSVTDCYSTGSVSSAGSDAGGFIGNHVSGTITHSYSAGAVNTGSDHGGFIGSYTVGSYVICFWRQDTINTTLYDTGAGDVSGIDIKSITQFQDTASGTGFQDTSGWSFPPWDMVSGGYYPHMSYETTDLPQ